MPLPDERPRKTVANLIGQFEKQKAVTPAVSIIPRTSSVASHRTGDSAVEDIKEKREWPPKSVPPPVLIDPAPYVSSAPDPQESSATEAPSVSPIQENVIESVPPVQIIPPTPAIPTPLTPVVDETVPVVSKPKPETVIKATPTKFKVASNHTSASPRTSIIKLNPPKVVSAPAKSSGRTSISTPTKTPLKSAITPRSPAPSPLISAPIRAKSPSEVSTKAPLTRPKTPSHLYTPTAASLARSRNSAPPPPVEKPKRKLTTDLTKPTAASASKMRSIGTPTAVSRSPKPAVTKSTIKPSTPSSKAPSTIKSTIKSPARPNTQNAPHIIPSTTDGPETVVSTLDPSEIHQPQEIKAAEGQIGDVVTHKQHLEGSDEIENYDNDFVDESQAPVGELGQEPVEGNLTGIHESADVDYVSDTDEVTRALNWSPSQDPQEVEPVAAENGVESEIKPSPGAGTELEDLVNMLQTAPKVERPSLEAAAGEIPDEH